MVPTFVVESHSPDSCGGESWSLLLWWKVIVPTLVVVSHGPHVCGCESWSLLSWW